MVWVALPLLMCVAIILFVDQEIMRMCLDNLQTPVILGRVILSSLSLARVTTWPQSLSKRPLRRKTAASSTTAQRWSVLYLRNIRRNHWMGFKGVGTMNRHNTSSQFNIIVVVCVILFSCLYTLCCITPTSTLHVCLYTMSSHSLYMCRNMNSCPLFLLLVLMTCIVMEPDRGMHKTWQSLSLCQSTIGESLAWPWKDICSCLIVISKCCIMCMCWVSMGPSLVTCWHRP